MVGKICFPQALLLFTVFKHYSKTSSTVTGEALCSWFWEGILQKVALAWDLVWAAFSLHLYNLYYEMDSTTHSRSSGALWNMHIWFSCNRIRSSQEPPQWKARKLVHCYIAEKFVDTAQYFISALNPQILESHDSVKLSTFLNLS